MLHRVRSEASITLEITVKRYLKSHLNSKLKALYHQLTALSLMEDMDCPRTASY